MSQDQVAAKRWRITSLDPEVDLEIVGQYQPDDGATDNAEVVTSSTSTVGSERPVVQVVSGGQRVVAIASSFRSRHNLDDIRPRIDQLKAIRDIDPALGRNPRVLFTWGETSVVGLAKVRIRITGRWITGLPRSCAFDLQIEESQPVGIDTSSPETGETLYVVLRDSETFETLGARYYRSPLKGDLIRRGNPAVSREAPGDRIRVLEAEHPEIRANMDPSSVVFLDPDDDATTWQPLIEELAQSRNAGTPWELLPEVIAGLV